MLCTPLSLANCASRCPPLMVLLGCPKHARHRARHNIHARTHQRQQQLGVWTAGQGGWVRRSVLLLDGLVFCKLAHAIGELLAGVVSVRIRGGRE
jgi:hypothetical protein